MPFSQAFLATGADRNKARASARIVTPFGPHEVRSSWGIEARVYEIVRRVTYLFFVLRDKLVLHHDPDSNRQSGETTGGHRRTSCRERRSCERSLDVNLDNPKCSASSTPPAAADRFYLVRTSVTLAIRLPKSLFDAASEVDPEESRGSAARVRGRCKGIRAGNVGKED